MREASFQARRCHLTSPTSGAVSLGYPSSPPLPTTTSTPLRIWLSSSTICIRYAAPSAAPLPRRSACVVLLVTCSNALHVVPEGCCGTVLLVLSAGTEAATRSAYEPQPSCVAVRMPSNTLKIVEIRQVQSFDSMLIKLMAQHGPTCSHRATCCYNTPLLALYSSICYNICWDAGEPQVQGISQTGGPGWHWNSGKWCGQGQCRHHSDQWA